MSGATGMAAGIAPAVAGPDSSGAATAGGASAGGATGGALSWATAAVPASNPTTIPHAHPPSDRPGAKFTSRITRQLAATRPDPGNSRFPYGSLSWSSPEKRAEKTRRASHSRRPVVRANRKRSTRAGCEVMRAEDGSNNRALLRLAIPGGLHRSHAPSRVGPTRWQPLQSAFLRTRPHLHGHVRRQV